MAIIEAFKTNQKLINNLKNDKHLIINDTQFAETILKE